MALDTDLAVFNSREQLIAVAEVRNRRGTSAAWAAMLRRNILAHRGFPNVQFFVLVTPERLFVWKDAGVEPELVEPDFDIDARPVFAPYFDGTQVDPQTVSRPAFELVVATWLGDLILPVGQRGESVGSDGWLVESGFLNAVRNGHLEYPTAA